MPTVPPDTSAEYRKWKQQSIAFILLVCFCIHMTTMVFILFGSSYTFGRTLRCIAETPLGNREEEIRQWCGRNTVEAPGKEDEVDGVEEM
jgi:hypothetical protein